MIVTGILFYVFSLISVASSVMVISSRNPVHSVLFLILTFFNAAGLFLLLGAEYLAMTLVIVYVGAVAVLFLFVVMMLNVNFVALREGFTRYLPVGACVGAVLFIELFFALSASLLGAMPTGNIATPTPDPSSVTNAEALGRVLYTDYAYPFQVSGLILLVAMIGAIVLTLRDRPGVRRQTIGVQVARKREDAVAVVKVATGEGAA